MPAPVIVSWSPEGVACVGIPVEMSSGPDYSSLEVLWLETPHTPHKLCYCPPFEGDQHLFSRCINTSSCNTHYSVTVNSDSVGLQHELTRIPVYFTLLQPCREQECIIRSLLAQYSIVLDKYREALTQNLPLNIAGVYSQDFSMGGSVCVNFANHTHHAAYI